MNYILFLVLVFILVFFVLLQSIKLKEPFTTPEQVTQDIKKKIWFHDPYTYNYASTHYEGRTNQEELLLNFLCFKFKGQKKQGWFSSGYEDPMKYVQDKLLCKTTLHDLDKENPTSISNIMDKINIDLNGEMKRYTELTNASILAPVYIILMQYPNKFYYDNYGGKGYKYTQFDIQGSNIKPYERKNVSTGKINYNCRGDNCKTIVDTKMLIVYPMYNKNKIEFYPNLCETYLLNKLPNNIKLFPKMKENEKNKQIKPNIKGIIDMIKVLNEDKLQITKHLNCFIECNNNTKYYCGCGTRMNGVDDPKDITKEERYKSFCKEPYKKENKETEEMFSHYLLMYRINELNTEVLTDIQLDVDTEQKITLLLNHNGCFDNNKNTQYMTFKELEQYIQSSSSI
jgi:hypothetical protein